MFGRNKIAMLVAEFLGTGFLTLVVLGVQRSTLGLPYFIAIAAGIAVAFGMYAFGNVSGGQFNPALTLALWTARRVKTLAAVLYIVAQMLGAWAAYGLYHYFVNAPVQAIHSNFSGRILIAEAVGTLIFAIGWAAASYWRVNNNRFAAVAGLSFAVGIVVASAASVGIINPAVALGVRSWVWGTYVLGPVIGAVVGVNLYGLLFAPVESLVSVGAGAATASRPRPTAAVAEKAAPAKKPARKPVAKKPASRRKR